MELRLKGAVHLFEVLAPFFIIKTSNSLNFPKIIFRLMLYFSLVEIGGTSPMVKK
jgi:hypothetical protein